MNEASSANVSSNRTSVNFYFAFDVEVELDIWDGHQVVIPIDFGRHQYSFSSSLQEKGKRIMKKCIWIFRNLFMVVMVFISVLPAWFEWYLMHLVRNTDYAL